MDVSVRVDEMFPPEPILVSGIKNLLALVLKDDWVNGYCLKCFLVVSCKEGGIRTGRQNVGETQREADLSRHS